MNKDELETRIQLLEGYLNNLYISATGSSAGVQATHFQGKVAAISEMVDAGKHHLKLLKIVKEAKESITFTRASLQSYVGVTTSPDYIRDVISRLKILEGYLNV